jgi:hypothetical protein
VDQRGNRVGGKQGVTRRNPVADHERSASMGEHKHLAKGGMNVMSSGSYYGSSSTTESAPYDDPATSGQEGSGSSSQQPDEDDDYNTISSPFDDQKSSVGSFPIDNGPEETSNGGLVDGSSSRSDVDTLTEAELFKDYVAPTDDYKQSVSADDFVPQVQENIDNGNIFLFAKVGVLFFLIKFILIINHLISHAGCRHYPAGEERPLPSNQELSSPHLNDCGRVRQRLILPKGLQRSLQRKCLEHQ